MVLIVKERKLFFKNWLRLLAFVNDKYDVIPGFGHPNTPVGLDIHDILKIRDKLWEDSSVIDEYIKTTDLNDEDLTITSSWKKFIKGRFVIVKHLVNFSVLLDEKNILYGVTGITDSIAEKMPDIPFVIGTVLLPFKGKIIYDSIITFPNITFGRNYRTSFRETYKKIKREKGIMTIID